MIPAPAKRPVVLKKAYIASAATMAAASYTTKMRKAPPSSWVSAEKLAPIPTAHGKRARAAASPRQSRTAPTRTSATVRPNDKYSGHQRTATTDSDNSNPCVTVPSTEASPSSPNTQHHKAFFQAAFTGIAMSRHKTARHRRPRAASVAAVVNSVAEGLRRTKDPSRLPARRNRAQWAAECRWQ